jgi:WD40 repeat protein
MFDLAPSKLVTTRISPDGRYLATASHDQMLIVWSLTNGKIYWRKRMTVPIGDFSWSPDRKYIAVGLADGSVEVIRLPQL